MPNVEIVALCDVDESHIAAKLKMLDEKGKKKPATYVDFRKLLEDKTIACRGDTQSLTSPPDHLGVPGRQDVYVEKPCSHNIFESQQIVAAAMEHAPHQGSQSRSSPALREAVQRMATGSSARSTWRAASADLAPTRLVTSRSRPSPLASTTTSGPGRPPSGTSPRTGSITTWMRTRATAIRQPGHPRGRHRQVGPGSDASDEGQRHWR